VIWWGKGSTREVWIARYGSNRCARRILIASETSLSKAPSPSNGQDRDPDSISREGSSWPAGALGVEEETHRVAQVQAVGEALVESASYRTAQVRHLRHLL
jgi:hypothetical protein